jgi:hypothetical protein
VAQSALQAVGQALDRGGLVTRRLEGRDESEIGHVPSLPSDRRNRTDVRTGPVAVHFGTTRPYLVRASVRRLIQPTSLWH